MTAAGAMNPRKATKHDALRDAQLRLKALVCETVSLRESLHRESERKGVALDSAKQQQQAAKSADRRLREAEFAARCELTRGRIVPRQFACARAL